MQSRHYLDLTTGSVNVQCRTSSENRRHASLITLIILALSCLLGIIVEGFSGASNNLLLPGSSFLKLRSTQSLSMSIGSITLVGAGPGDPDLLTMQAYKAIKNADLIVADRLISTAILDTISCQLMVARKRPGCAEVAQQEVYQWVVEAAKSGMKVVRLKIGDPFLFGRGGEEVLEYRKFGFEPIVCAGISSSYAAPLVANIPITHRDVASQVVICTGFGRDRAKMEVPIYQEKQTVVLLMAVGRIGDIAAEMIAHKGFPASTPVAIVEWATTPQQRCLRGTLSNVQEVVQRNNAQPPATIIVGHAVNVLNQAT